MLYLLDANCFIGASQMYYPLDRVPEYWEWVLVEAQAGHIKLPQETYEEVANGHDEISDWAKANKDQLLLDEVVDGGKVTVVIETGYAPDLSEAEIEKLGKDPILISYGYRNGERTIVSKEVSSPAKTRANRKVPDVCAGLAMACIDDFQLIKLLDFRTRRR